MYTLKKTTSTTKPTDLHLSGSWDQIVFFLFCFFNFYCLLVGSLMTIIKWHLVRWLLFVVIVVLWKLWAHVTFKCPAQHACQVLCLTWLSESFVQSVFKGIYMCDRLKPVMLLLCPSYEKGLSMNPESSLFFYVMHFSRN